MIEIIINMSNLKRSGFNMDDELILVRPSMEYEKQAINLIEEVEKVDTDEKIRYSGFSIFHYH